MPVPLRSEDLVEDQLSPVGPAVAGAPGVAKGTPADDDAGAEDDPAAVDDAGAEPEPFGAEVELRGADDPDD